MFKEKPQSAMAALLDFEDDSSAIVEPPPNKPTSEKMVTKEGTYKSAFIPSVEKLSDPKIVLIEVDPADCILWRFADRPSDELGDINALAQSLKEHGQQEPILIRSNRQNSPHKYEVIFGNRRWRAAQIASIKLQAICKEVTDQEASLCQKEENANRKEISDYARAMSYRAQISGGVFKSETELSKFLCISKQALNDLMAYLRVPERLREAISNYRNLSKKMAIKLASLSRNKDTLDVLIHLAPKISDHTITTSNLDLRIQHYLAPPIRKNAVLLHKKIYEKRDPSGRLLYRTRLQANGDISLLLDRTLLHENGIEALHEQFFTFLNDYLNAKE